MELLDTMTSGYSVQFGCLFYCYFFFC